jgi:hypothetical protein
MCSMCESPLLRGALQVASECSYKRGEATHAASGTSLSGVKLPYASRFSLVGTGCDNEPCKRGDSTVCTLAAVLHSVKKTGVYIHLMEESEGSPDVVMEVTESMTSRFCVVVVFHSAASIVGTSCVVHTGSMETGLEIQEEEVLSMLTRLQSASSSTVFYWSPRSLGYSSVLSQSPESSWIAYMSSNLREGDVHKGMQMIYASPGLKAFPCFYRDTKRGEMAVVGKGGSCRTAWNDLEVEMSALCDTVAQRVYCSSAPTGRCFCCQYIINLHEQIHSGHKGGAEETFKVRLCKKFQQNTKRKGGG